jgi:hypothetical protein
VTAAHLPQAATPEQAAPQLAAVAESVTGHRISARLSRIGNVPVLTIEEPTDGSDPTTVSIHPDPSTPDLPLECTCLWTLAPDATPEAIGQALIAILNAIRPIAIPSGHGDEDTPPR